LSSSQNGEGKEVLAYTLEFNHHPLRNLTPLALGGRDPKELDWSIEVEPFSNFSFQMMRSNILSLCTDDQFSNIRDSVVFLKPPPQPLPEEIELLHTSYEDQLKDLNPDQAKCVLKSLLCGGISPEEGILSGRYHMVLGTPGSGKTTTIVALVKILASLKQRVLLVNSTNQATDNILLRLKESGFDDFIRITNNLSSVEPALHGNAKTTSMFESMKAIKETFDSTYVFGTTCLQMNNTLLLCVNGGRFDYCVMDEASQVSEPLALGPVLISDRFVMVGDYYQVSPLVKSPLAERKGLGISLFERLCRAHPQNVTVLKRQYRMNRDILALSNEIVYNGVMIQGQCNEESLRVQYQTNAK